jgi:hypothetical protein
MLDKEYFISFYQYILYQKCIELTFRWIFVFD